MCPEIRRRLIKLHTAARRTCPRAPGKAMILSVLTFPSHSTRIYALPSSTGGSTLTCWSVYLNAEEFFASKSSVFSSSTRAALAIAACIRIFGHSPFMLIQGSPRYDCSSGRAGTPVRQPHRGTFKVNPLLQFAVKWGTVYTKIVFLPPKKLCNFLTFFK